MENALGNGFKLISQIGEGGHASVWKAHHVSLDRNVAIKILRPEHARSEEDIRRFSEEAQRTAHLRHPGIVQVYDAFLRDGAWCIVMEYVDGISLGDRIERGGPLPQSLALEVARGVAEALRYAWETAGIIHCDVKPHNILLGIDRSVKIGDFGVARMTATARAETPVGEILCTPYYTAPEAILESRPPDPRSDIYSLGATLYHAVTGRALFGEYEAHTALRLQTLGTDIAPGLANPRLTRPFCLLIEKMLAKDPEQRYRLWDDVIRDIRRVQQKRAPLTPLPETAACTVRPLPPASAAAMTPVPASSERPTIRAPGDEEGTLPAKAPTVGAEYRQRLAALLRRKWTVPASIAASLVFLFLYGFVRTHSAVLRPGEAAPADGGARAAAEVAETLAWIEQHPEPSQVSIERLEHVLPQAVGTPHETVLRSRLNQLREALRAGVAAALARIESDVRLLLERGEYGQAAERYQKYDGAFAAETSASRMTLAAKYCERQSERDRKEAARENAFSEFLDGLAADLLDRGPASTANRVRTAMEKDLSMAGRKDVVALLVTLESASRGRLSILESFERDVGREVSIELLHGTENLTVWKVWPDSDRVLCRETRPSQSGGVTIHEKNLAVDNLSLGERLRRISISNDRAAALAKGWEAVRLGAYSQAQDLLSQIDPLLSTRLLEKISRLPPRGAGSLPSS